MTISRKTIHRVRNLALFLVAAVSFPVQVLAQNPHIDLTIVGVPGAEKIQFTNSACPDRANEMGCVLMARNNRAWISWELDQDSYQQGWQIQRLDFSPDGVHWGDPGYPLKDCTVASFDLTGDDRISGHASTAHGQANNKRMRIWDENFNDARGPDPLTPCVTHYRLTAVNVNTGNTADSDPVIDNRGRD